MRNPKSQIPNSKGAVLLPTILIFGFIIIAIALLALFITSVLNRSNYQIRLSAAALAAAQTGIKDAQLRIIRSNDWPSTNCDTNQSAGAGNNTYELPLAANKAYVCIKKDVLIDRVEYTVKSLGEVRGVKRQLRTVLVADPISHQVQAQLTHEVEF